MDPYLRGIVAAAEQDRWLPPLRIVAGDTLFVGTPGPAKSYREKVEFAFGEEHYNAKGRPSKKKAAVQFEESRAHGAQVGAHLAGAIGDESGDVLTLYDCQVWPASGGDGVKVAAVRIPLTSVDGWWPGSGEVLKAPSGGGWLLGFGVLVPVDTG